jgi:hypothetical protein
VVTSNSSPDSSSGKRQTLFPHSAHKETYERGLATIPLPTLSRRVHAPVTRPQQSGKRRVIRAISICACPFGDRMRACIELDTCARRAPMHRVGLDSFATLTKGWAVVAIVNKELRRT